ncbi:hypothetical protein BKA66DRAFT_588613 [Pyrenochaeta sp. MPI-SDFR-AT-0127]|nr:hypothetical protein BKA66DRAFT_588613 [Pyrenochaeta sp. MPI-SDFR-AT-0127]
MVPQPVKASPANEQWLAFRRKHEEELRVFRREVERSQLEFNHRVETTRTSLLAKHAKEEQEFWNKQDQLKGKARAKAVAEIVGKFKGKVSEKRRTVSKTLISSPTKNAKQPLLKPSIVPVQHAEIRQSTKLQRSRWAQKKTVSEVINLCSDDEDEPVYVKKTTAIAPLPQSASFNAVDPNLQCKGSNSSTPTTALLHTINSPRHTADPSSAATIPEFSIPSVTLELFGKNSKKYWATPKNPHLEREQSILEEKASNSVAPKLTPLVLTSAGSNGDDVDIPASEYSQRKTQVHLASSKALTVIPPDNNCSNVDHGKEHDAFFYHDSASQPSLRMTQISVGAVQEQSDVDLPMLDAPQSTRTMELESQPSIEGVHFPLAQNSSNPVKFLGARLDTKNDEVEPGIHSSITIRPQQPLLPTPPCTEKLSKGGNQTRRVHLPSPPPSQVSTSEPVTPTQGKGLEAIGFNKPFVSASASKDTALRNGRAGTVDSRASNFNLPVTPNSKGSASVPSRTGPSFTQKRKIEVNLSSDEEDGSDFSPSGDEEPDLPGAISRRVKKHAPAPKKARVSTTSLPKSKTPSPPTALAVPLANGKNRLGFRVPAKPKRCSAAAAASSLHKPCSTLSGKSTLSTPNVPSKPKSHQQPTSEVPKKQSSKPTFKRTSLISTACSAVPRKARLEAEAKIQSLITADEEFWTQESILGAAEQEDRLNGALAERVRGMSITPTPSACDTDPARSDQPASQHEDVPDIGEDVLVDQAPRNSWTHARSMGDRHVARSLGPMYQRCGQDVEDSDFSE